MKVLKEDATCILFADDIKLYTELKVDADIINLQEALDSIFQWSVKWQMPVSSAKCQLPEKLTRTCAATRHNFQLLC